MYVHQCPVKMLNSMTQLSGVWFEISFWISLASQHGVSMQCNSNQTKLTWASDVSTPYVAFLTLVNTKSWLKVSFLAFQYHFVTVLEFLIHWPWKDNSGFVWNVRLVTWGNYTELKLKNPQCYHLKRFRPICLWCMELLL